MSIFTPKAPCGIFAGQGGLTTTLSFVRATAALQHRAPTQTAGGEVLTSYTPIGTLTGDLQPNKGGIQRLIAGQVVEVAYYFFVLGSPNVQELDRTIVEGRQTEVVAVNQFGGDYAEILLKQIGR